MRRCKDNWVNATQILKCCNFPKAKRTKILEKGVQQGLHEKIQGGYGRFQGTWVPLEDAQRLAANYGVTPALAPVLYLDLNDPNLVIPKKIKQMNKDGTPVKRKYVKKSKKLEETPTKKQKYGDSELYGSASEDSFRGGQMGHQSISQTQQQLQYQMQPQQVLQHQQQLRAQQQQQLQLHSQLPPTFSQPEFMVGANTSIPNFGSNQNSNQAIQDDFQNYQMYQRFQQQQQQQQMPLQPQQQLPPQHHQQQLAHEFSLLIPQQQVPQSIPTSQQKFLNSMGNAAYGNFPNSISNQQHLQLMGQFQHNNTHALSQSTNETNWSQDENNKESDTSVSSNEDGTNKHRGGRVPLNASIAAEDSRILNTSMTENNQSPKLIGINGTAHSGGIDTDDENSYSAQLLRFFSEDNAPIPYFIHNLPYDFNINEAIDDEGHTPLHWSASIGNYNMIHLLITKGANPLVVNNFGLNPLSKLVLFNNCYELKNFPKVLDDLELCLINTDINGRTPIHYLCQFAKVKSKYESLRYYLDIILGKLNSLSNREANKQLTNLLKNVIDHQDVNGDTCLHLAAKSTSTKVVKLLLSYGARDDLINVNNETAKMIIQNYNLLGGTEERGKDIDSNGAILATPMQSFGGKIETPDTQRTTVQDDEEGLDDGREDGSKRDFVSREHLNQLNINEDNKENIFKEETLKSIDGISTPIQNGGAKLHSSLQPQLLQLPVISEKTTHESTPIRGPDSRRHPKGSFLTSSTNKEEGDTSILTYEPKPPQLDDDGKLVSQEEKMQEEKLTLNSLDTEETLSTSYKLPMNDLSSMIHGMINSLSSTYSDEDKNIDIQIRNTKRELKNKKEKLEASIKKVNSMLVKSGFPEVSDLQEGQKLVLEEIDNHSDLLQVKEQELLKVLEKNQAFQLASLVQEKEGLISIEEEQLEAQENDSKENNEKLRQEKREMAIQLSKLQLKRTTLLSDITNSIKYYGIDSKMYKYRKLISLSCGLKMEDIDGLLDGIEEHLMESS